jgi:hypothetical protein
MSKFASGQDRSSAARAGGYSLSPLPSGVTGGICTRLHRNHKPAAHCIAFGHT